MPESDLIPMPKDTPPPPNMETDSSVFPLAPPRAGPPTPRAPKQSTASHPTRYGKLLKTLIKQRRMSQHAFAVRIRQTTGVPVSQNMLSDVLRGKVKVPLHWCAAIASTFALTETQHRQFDAAAAADHGLQVEISPLPKTAKAAGDHPAAILDS